MAHGSIACAERTVAELTRDPRVLEVLKAKGINHCCGAHLSLREAAAAAGVPLDEILAAIEATGAVPA
jgi:iron-sulfur cluster repair protein YtfE (RIC family)